MKFAEDAEEDSDSSVAPQSADQSNYDWGFEQPSAHNQPLQKGKGNTAASKESQSSKTRSPKSLTNASAAERSQKRGKENVKALSKETKRTSIAKQSRRRPKKKAKIPPKEIYQGQTDKRTSLRPRGGIQRTGTGRKSWKIVIHRPNNNSEFFHPDNYRRQRKSG